MTLRYCNPVHLGYFADPFVLRLDDGTYVAYGTGDVVDGRAFAVLRSSDLVSWEPAGGALEPLPPEHGSDYWAPEVAETRAASGCTTRSGTATPATICGWPRPTSRPARSSTKAST
jgi:hypothetical protein